MIIHPLRIATVLADHAEGFREDFRGKVLDLQGNPHTVWSGIDPSLPGSPADFRIDFIPAAIEVNGVVIHIDTDLIDSWEEIDAVQLHGVHSDSLRDAYQFEAEPGDTVTVDTLLPAAGPGHESDRQRRDWDRLVL